MAAFSKVRRPSNPMYIQENNNFISDDSGGELTEEGREELVYRRKYQMLLERCDILQQDNERLVHRIQEIQRYTRRGRLERAFMISRLEEYNDDWRAAANLLMSGMNTVLKKNIQKTRTNVLKNPSAEKANKGPATPQAIVKKCKPRRKDKDGVKRSRDHGQNKPKPKPSQQPEESQEPPVTWNAVEVEKQADIWWN